MRRALAVAAAMVSATVPVLALAAPPPTPLAHPRTDAPVPPRLPAAPPWLAKGGMLGCIDAARKQQPPPAQGDPLALVECLHGRLGPFTGAPRTAGMHRAAAGSSTSSCGQTTGRCPSWVAEYSDPQFAPYAWESTAGMVVSPHGDRVFSTASDIQLDSGENRYVTVARDAVSGDQLWATPFEGPRALNQADLNTESLAIAVSPDGASVYVTGRMNPGPDGFALGAGEMGMGTVAYDAASGRQLWASYDGGDSSRFGYAVGTAVTVSPDGRLVYVTGTHAYPATHANGLSTIGLEAATIAYDATTGTEVWRRTYADRLWTIGLAVAASSDGTKLFVTGTSYDPDNGYAGYATVAYTAGSDGGARLWAQGYSPDPSVANDSIPTGLVVSPDAGAIFVTGVSAGGDLSSAAATLAYDAATGVQRWLERYAGEGSSGASGLIATPDGTRIVIAGVDGPPPFGINPQHPPEALTVAYDPVSGTQQWASLYQAQSGPNGALSGASAALAIASSSDSATLYITGYAQSLVGADVFGAVSAMTVAYQSAGGAQGWASEYNGSGQDLDVGEAVGVGAGGSVLAGAVAWDAGASYPSMGLIGYASAQAAHVPADGSTSSLPPGGCNSLHTEGNPLPALGSNIFTAAAAITPGDVWAVGGDVATPGLAPGLTGVSSSLTEHWDGTTWTSVPNPYSAAPTTWSAFDQHALLAVSADATNDVWAVGASGTTLRWNGVGWAVIPNALASADAALLGVAAVAPGDVWAVGGGLVEHWNGAAWLPVTVQQGMFAVGVSADAATDAWIVGVDSANHPAVFHWDGSTWSESTAPDPGSGNVTYTEFIAVKAITPNDAWIVGDTHSSQDPDQYGNPGHIPFAEHWDGSTWSMTFPPVSQPVRGPGYLTSISALSPDDVWAAGNSDDTFANPPFAPLLEHWDGTQWTQIPTQGPAVGAPGSSAGGFNAIWGVAAAGPGDVWGVGEYGSLARGVVPLTEHYTHSGTGPPDLCLGLTATPSPAVEGQPLTYMANAFNSGPGTAANVQLTATLPAGATLDGLQPSAGSCTPDPVITCNLGEVPADEQATVRITVTPVRGNSTVSASVSSSSGSSDPAEDLRTLATSVICVTAPCSTGTPAPAVPEAPAAAALLAVALLGAPLAVRHRRREKP